ncbi:MAG: hypothetical protein P9M14_15125 [Candidatus Alcyoniella australis]|nr:hypothetical protein [Candidatus Alcyoniella australis]
MKLNSSRSFVLILTLVLALSLTLWAGCAKDTGDDDDDDDDGQGVGAYTFYLNMVPVPLADFTPQGFMVIDAEGSEQQVQGLNVADVLLSIPQFASDAPRFTYDFVSSFDAELSDRVGDENLPTLDQLQDAVFYECAADLCIGWIAEPAKGDYHASQMNNGSLVSLPIAGEFEMTDLADVNQRDGDDPAQLGQTLCVNGVVTVGTRVIVDGSYLKTFIQQKTDGVKVFADMSSTEEDDGYDGALMSEISTYEGDELFVKGRVTVHGNMLEFIPISGYHVVKLSINNEVPDPQPTTIDELVASPYDYAGSLIRLSDLSIVDIDPEDATTDWPPYAQKSKDITIRHSSGGPKANLRIYERTGVPGSNKPDDGFDMDGIMFVDDALAGVFARKIEDINPSDERLEGYVNVTVYGEQLEANVNLATLPTCLYDVGDGPQPVVSLASVIRAAGLNREPKKFEYKPVAYDERKPFDKISFDEQKSGVLYQDEPTSSEQPDPLVSSHYWEEMNLSDIYFLHGVTKIEAIREVEPPPEGDAVHGEGITLKINGRKFAINFDTMDTVDYEGHEAIAIADFVSDYVIELFAMDGSFTTDQIKVLYDYKIEPWQGKSDVIVTWDDMQNGYLIIDDPPYSVFPDLGESARVDDLYVIDMLRFIEVQDPPGDPVKIYLRDCDTSEVEVEPDVYEEVVYFKTVLELGGVDVDGDMYLYDVNIHAADEFVSTWTYGHNHVENMYYRPYANRGFIDDPDLSEWGGRVSTKAVDKLILINVPQEAPSIPVLIGGDTLWGSDANTCEGCHYKHDQLQLPINCYSCHDEP